MILNFRQADAPENAEKTEAEDQYETNGGDEFTRQGAIIVKQIHGHRARDTAGSIDRAGKNDRHTLNEHVTQNPAAAAGDSADEHTSKHISTMVDDHQGGRSSKSRKPNGISYIKDTADVIFAQCFMPRIKLIDDERTYNGGNDRSNIGIVCKENGNPVLKEDVTQNPTAACSGDRKYDNTHQVEMLLQCGNYT